MDPLRVLSGSVGAHQSSSEDRLGFAWNLSYTNSSDSSFGRQPDTSTSRFSSAIAGTGGTSGNLTWNLFDPSANSQELIDYISKTKKPCILSTGMSEEEDINLTPMLDVVFILLIFFRLSNISF